MNILRKRQKRNLRRGVIELTAEEAIHEIDSCYGPCGEMCVNCRSAYHLKDYRDVIIELLNENKDLRKRVAELSEIVRF